MEFREEFVFVILGVFVVGSLERRTIRYPRCFRRLPICMSV